MIWKSIIMYWAVIFSLYMVSIRMRYKGNDKRAIEIIKGANAAFSNKRIRSYSVHDDRYNNTVSKKVLSIDVWELKPSDIHRVPPFSSVWFAFVDITHLPSFEYGTLTLKYYHELLDSLNEKHLPRFRPTRPIPMTFFRGFNFEIFDSMIRALLVEHHFSLTAYNPNTVTMTLQWNSVGQDIRYEPDNGAGVKIWYELFGGTFFISFHGLFTYI